MKALRTIKLFDGQVLRAKLTVEETLSGYIATSWNPDDCYEFDREVEEFETLSRAIAHMYEKALYAALTFTNLTIKED